MRLFHYDQDWPADAAFAFFASPEEAVANDLKDGANEPHQYDTRDAR